MVLHCCWSLNFPEGTSRGINKVLSVYFHMYFHSHNYQQWPCLMFLPLRGWVYDVGACLPYKDMSFSNKLIVNRSQTDGRPLKLKISLESCSMKCVFILLSCFLPPKVTRRKKGRNRPTVSPNPRPAVLTAWLQRSWRKSRKRSEA